MDNKQNKQIQDDEIDLVELLGIVIKWRKLLISIVAVFTVIGFFTVTYREYKKAKANAPVVVSKDTAVIAIKSKNDILKATYVLLTKDTAMQNASSTYNFSVNFNDFIIFHLPQQLHSFSNNNFIRFISLNTSSYTNFIICSCI